MSDRARDRQCSSPGDPTFRSVACEQDKIARDPELYGSLVCLTAFGPRHKVAEMISTLRYIVASTPRTGSYLLCEGLQSSGIAGRPTEVFSPDFQAIWRRRWGMSQNAGFAEYFQRAIRHGTTSNGVYGLKIHWMHVQTLATQAGFAGAYDDILEYLFPQSRFVHMTRRDRRAQAISYYRALSTNEWWQIEGVENDQSNGSTPVFDAAAILALEREVSHQEDGWQQYFRKRDLKPLVVEYETLAAEYPAQVARVLSYLGLDSSVASSVPPPRLVQQSDAQSLSWRCRLDDDDCARRRT
jgi:trehalose 2-sulfotransferase